VQFRRAGRPEVQINIAPLVDVVFLLVIFFAVSTTFLDTAGLKLELPASSSEAAPERRDLVVLLTEDGQALFEGAEVGIEELKAQLSVALEQGGSRQVVLRADEQTLHGRVVEVMDAIRDAGAEGLTVAARAPGS